jgi:hypothetical protein
VGQQWTHAPRLKLFSQRLVQAADRAGTGSHPGQFFRDFAD